MAERAEEACGLLSRLIAKEISPTPVLVQPPMLPTSQKMMTAADPMKRLIDRAHELEQDSRILNVTVAGGFPPANVPDAGLSILVTTDREPELARRAATELARLAWDHRDEFHGGVASFNEAAALLRTIPRRPEKPTVIVDIGDNPWTGGPGDSVELVRFLLEEAVEDAAVALVADPVTVRQAVAAGAGATIRVSLGARTDLLHGDPLEATATVLSLSDGRYVNEGPMMAGVAVDLGETAVLKIDEVTVIVTSRAETPIDLNIFRRHGIDPINRRVIGLKGKGHFRAAFEPIASQVILVEGPGITGSDLSRLDLDRVRRPIWPLDPDAPFARSHEE
jgi:microcystin degradation protein MlrC